MASQIAVGRRKLRCQSPLLPDNPRPSTYSPRCRPAAPLLFSNSARCPAAVFPPRKIRGLDIASSDRTRPAYSLSLSDPAFRMLPLIPLPPSGVTKDSSSPPSARSWYRWFRRPASFPAQSYACPSLLPADLP